MSQDKEHFENLHWADSIAQKAIEAFPDEQKYVIASGTTPSGMIHVGHFREVVTNELARRALEDKGKKTKFNYSWDSYDAFRKVPKNLPPEFEKHLRLPNAFMPDPWGCHDNFSDHYLEGFKKALAVFHFPLEFQEQHKLQTSGIYADGIKEMLNKRDEIRKILNRYKHKELDEDWFPLTLFCEKCNKDTTTLSDYDEKYSVSYECSNCGQKDRINFKEKAIVKLLWRSDWPMRWLHFGVNVEGGGKDYATKGSAWYTGRDIVEELFDRPAPVPTFYSWIKMKGSGGKVSSSQGDGATVDDVLKIYTPEVILFFFAGSRPMTEIELSFDVDVIKIYEDFDYMERLYYGEEEETNEKKKAYMKRIYELSQVGENRTPQKKMPLQIGFRHLTTVAQASDFDFAKVEEYYSKELKTDFDKKRLKERFECVKNWLELYAPEEMKFSLNIEVPKELAKNLTKEQKALISSVAEALESAKEADSFNESVRELVGSSGMKPKEVFGLFYELLISKSRGPRLAPFMFENREKFLKLLRKV